MSHRVGSQLAACFALLTLGASCGGDDGPNGGSGGAAGSAGAGGAGGSGACTAQSHDDDIVLDLAGATGVPVVVRQAIAVGDRVLLCGGESVVLVDSSKASVVAGPHLKDCRGLAVSGETRAVMVSESGQITLFSLDTSATPLTELDTVARASTSFYGVTLSADTALVAGGSAGVIAYSVSGDKLAESGVWTAPKNARSVASVGTSAVVFDEFEKGKESAGGTLHLLDSTGQALDSVTGLLGLAGRLLVDGTRVVALRPGAGFDVLEVGATKLTQSYTTAFAHGSPQGAALSGDDLVIASGSQLLRFTLSSTDASLTSIEQRPARGELDGDYFVDVVRTGSGAWQAVTSRQLVALTLGAGKAAPHFIADAYAHVIPSGQPEALIRLTNVGSEQLIVTGVSAPAPIMPEIYADTATAVDGCPDQFSVEPGKPFLIFQRYSGSAAGIQQSLISIASNDPNGPLEIVGETNRPVPAVGEALEAFELPTVRGTTIRSQDYLGKVWLAKLYNPT